MIPQHFKYLLLFFVISIININSPFSLEKGFVYLDEIDPTIQKSLRYYGDQNFVGKPIEGYNASRIILTKEAAESLKKAQSIFKKSGYSIVVYDAYRPQSAVNQFMDWSMDRDDQKMKSQYYPRVNKQDVFKLGYVAEKSSHSRGSTVDITLIPINMTVQGICSKKRALKDSFEVIFLDDGTVDMGTSFDLFDTSSHYENDLVEEKYQGLRHFLKEKMESCGFKNYAEEWWHFTLKDEPFPNTYFDFPIK